VVRNMILMVATVSRISCYSAVCYDTPVSLGFDIGGGGGGGGLEI
jgi:hypothetical protein